MLNDYFCGQLHQSVNVLFPLENTEEVISLTYGEICPVPGVSSALIGVVNQRGKLLWVLDLSELLQIFPNQETRRSQDNLTLLVLNKNKNSEQQIGCVVSDLKGIISIDLSIQSLVLSSSPSWQLLGANTLEIDAQSYNMIDVQTALNNIYNLIDPNKLVTKL